MCFPEELRKALGQKCLELQKAGEQSDFRQLSLDQTVGLEYFKALHGLYTATAAGTSARDSGLTSSPLLVGPYLQRQKIEAKESLTEETIGRSCTVTILTQRSWSTNSSNSSSAATD